MEMKDKFETEGNRDSRGHNRNPPLVRADHENATWSKNDFQLSRTQVASIHGMNGRTEVTKSRDLSRNRGKRRFFGDKGKRPNQPPTAVCPVVSSRKVMRNQEKNSYQTDTRPMRYALYFQSRGLRMTNLEFGLRETRLWS